MMKLLITGSDGQLGRELQYILKNGVSKLGSIPQILQDTAVTLVDINTLDIADTASVFAFVEQDRPDIIINCAAYTNVDGCEKNRETAMKANAIGPRNLAVASERIGAKLLHISTDYIFSGDQDRAYDEWNLGDPQTIYGLSKYLGEQYVREFCHKYFIIRSAWLYGFFGANFVKSILAKAREGQSLKVVNDQIGNPTNATDLAHFLLQIAVTEEYGIYHCTNSGECSWYEFAKELIKLSGMQGKIEPCTTEEYPRPAKRPRNSSLNNLVLHCTLNYCMRHWKEAITDFMSHYDKEEGAFKI